MSASSPIAPREAPAALACLAPALRYGAEPSIVEHNLSRIALALDALDAQIVLLPQGCLSGGYGLPAREACLHTLSALHALASQRGLLLAGAERFAGELWGFVLGAGEHDTLWQRSIAEDQGAAEIAILDSPCGRIACLPGADLQHAEYVRLAILQGAEVLLHPTVELSNERSSARHFARGARAWENHAYIAVCSSGNIDDDRGIAIGLGATIQEVWHPSGHLIVCESGRCATAMIDLTLLRTRRLDPWVNFPAQLRTQLYAREFANAVVRERAAPASAPEAPEAYDVLLMQSHQQFVTAPETRDATIAANLQGALGLARMFAMRPTTRLVVFPEFFLQGAGAPHPHEYWERCGIRIPGPETAQLADFARACNVYVCAAVLEYDPSWPRRYFNTSIILSPAGEIILRYRKLQCADLNGLLNVTTPGNIYSAYVERYGTDALIPVVDTPIGRLGTLICFDSNWPELWRVLALKGAEIICNPTSEIHSNRRPYWYQAKRGHAAHHLLYVASANAGSEQFFPGAPITAMNRGHSALIDFHGELVACADGPGVIPLLGRIELGALRRTRAALAEDPAVRFRPDAVAPGYAAFPGFPLDCFLHTPMETASEGPALVAAHLQRLHAAGVYRAP